MADLDYVKSVEAELQSQIEKAKSDSSRRVEVAKSTRDSVLKEKCAEAERKVGLITDSTIKDAEEKAKVLLADSEGRISKLKSLKQGKVDEAVSIILKELGVQVA